MMSKAILIFTAITLNDVLWRQVILPVWPDGYRICSIFGYLEQWEYAQYCRFFAWVYLKFARYKINGQKIAKDFVFFPKWRTFAKSGHTASYLWWHKPEKTHLLWKGKYRWTAGLLFSWCFADIKLSTDWLGWSIPNQWNRMWYLTWQSISVFSALAQKLDTCRHIQWHHTWDKTSDDLRKHFKIILEDSLQLIF